MSIRNAFFNRKFLHSVRVAFASVALSLYFCAYAYAQSKNPDVAAELDTLLANKHYPQLEQALMNEDLKPFARGLYVNQTTDRSPELAKWAYGANYARLVEIKRKYDPDNLLQLNQNINPG
jgi:hypothetical protein